MKNLTKELQERDFTIELPQWGAHELITLTEKDSVTLKVKGSDIKELAQTVQATLERVKEIVEGEKTPDLESHGYDHEAVDYGYNQALDDIINKLDISIK